MGASVRCGDDEVVSARRHSEHRASSLRSAGAPFRAPTPPRRSRPIPCAPTPPFFRRRAPSPPFRRTRRAISPRLLGGSRRAVRPRSLCALSRARARARLTRSVGVVPLSTRIAEPRAHRHPRHPHSNGGMFRHPSRHPLDRRLLGRGTTSGHRRSAPPAEKNSDASFPGQYSGCSASASAPSSATPVAFAGGGFHGAGNAGWSSNHAAPSPRVRCVPPAPPRVGRDSAAAAAAAGGPPPQPSAAPRRHPRRRIRRPHPNAPIETSRHDPILPIRAQTTQSARHALRMVEILLEGERAFHV